jgi:hypothetical protein
MVKRIWSNSLERCKFSWNFSYWKIYRRRWSSWFFIY